MKVVTLLLALIVACSVHAQTTNAGTDFWICFLENSDSLKVNASPNQFIFMTAVNTTTASVEVGGSTRSYAVGPNQVTTVTIPVAQGLVKADAGAISTKSIHVFSQDSTPINVSIMSDKAYSSDGTTCIPTDGLGTRYRASGYRQFGNLSDLSSEFAIVGTENFTTVTIEYVQPITNPPQTILLQQGEVYFVRAGSVNPRGSDLSGTLITSDRPVAVFSGHACASIPVNYPYCDHLVEELLPTNLWGQLYYTVPMRGRNGDTYRIYADQDNTEVYINGILYTTLAGGSFYERVLRGEAEIYGSRPIQVVQYANSSRYDLRNGDPSMMIIPPTDLYVQGDVTFSTPVDCALYPENYISVIVPRIYTSNVVLDNYSIARTEWNPLPRHNGDVEFSRARISVKGGVHRIGWGTYPVGDDAVSMMVYEYGWSAYNAYAYPAVFNTVLTSRILTTTKKVDYGVVYGNTSPVVTTIGVHNTGPQSIELIESHFNMNEGTFTILSPKLPVSLQKDSSVDIRFRFDPNTIGYGKYASTLIIKGSSNTQACVALTALRDSLGSSLITPHREMKSTLQLAVEILSVYPVPTKTTATILIRVHSKGVFGIELTDVQGQLHFKESRTLTEGDHEITLPTNGLPSGTYSIRVIGGETIETTSLVVSK